MRKLILMIIMITAMVIPPSVAWAEDASDDDYIVITCTGDVTLGYKNDEDHSNSMPHYLAVNDMDYSLIFRNILPLTQTDDLTIINLETTFTDSTYKNDRAFCFRAPYDYVEILKLGGIDAVTIANNHQYDYFDRGRYDTIRTLRSENIIISGENYTGTYEVKGVKIGLLGYNMIKSRFKFAEAMTRDIPYMKKTHDIVLVNFHWGSEKIYQASRDQQAYGHLAVDLGADLVVGHHPHVINGIEFYNGKYIVYSMGNCSFAGNHRPYDFDMYLFQQRFQITADGVVPAGAKVIPGRVSSQERANDFTPTPSIDNEKITILNKVLITSKHMEYGVMEVSADHWIEVPLTQFDFRENVVVEKVP